MQRTIYYISKFISLIFLIIAIIILSLGIARSGRYFKGYLSLNKSVTGYVADYYTLDDKEPLKGQETVLKPEKEYPVIKYVAERKEYTHKGTAEIGEYPYKKGIKVVMKYDSYNPEISAYKLEAQEEAMFLLMHIAAFVFFFIFSLIFSKDKLKKQEFNVYEEDTDDIVNKLSTKTKKKKKEEKTVKVKKRSNWNDADNFKDFEDILKENIRKQNQ